MQGKLDEALDAYEKSILIRSDNPEAFYNMGNVLKHQNKLEKKFYGIILMLLMHTKSLYCLSLIQLKLIIIWVTHLKV